MLIGILAILVTLVLSAFFSGTEIAFITVNRLKALTLIHKREKAEKRTRRLGNLFREFLDNPAKFLTTTLVGNNVALVVYSSLMAIYLQPPLEHLLHNILHIEEGAEILILILQTLIASLIVLIFGEILPKTFFRDVAERVLPVLATWLAISYYLLWPLIKLAEFSANQLVKLFGGSAEPFTTFIRRDIEVVIRESIAGGTLQLPKDESELLENILELHMLTVKEVMIPRTQIVATDVQSSVEAVIKKIKESGHSRIPVYEENIDNIIGIVYAIDLFKRPRTLQEILRDVRFVPESMLANELLEEFLATHTSIAIVIDEFGGTAGLVTIEDLIEEVTGDIRDEFDQDELTPRIQKIKDEFLVAGRTELEEITEICGIPFKEDTEDYETIAGFLLNKLGRIPNVGEEYEHQGYMIKITKARPHRIDQVKITPKTTYQKPSVAQARPVKET